jgi:hypothetical protein
MTAVSNSKDSSQDFFDFVCKGTNQKEKSKQLADLDKAEKLLDDHPKDPKIRYDLAKLHMSSGNHIAALTLLKLTSSQIKATPSKQLSRDKVKEKIKECEKKVDDETKAIGKLISKTPYSYEKDITKLSTLNVSKKIQKLVAKEKKLLPIEAALIRLYTGSGSYAFNTFLRKDKKEIQRSLDKFPEKKHDSTLSFVQKMIPIVKHALKKLPSLQSQHPKSKGKNDQKRTVFRGMSVPSQFIDQLQKEHKMRNPGFSSTSLNASIAMNFAKGGSNGKKPLLLIVEAKTGVPIHLFSKFRDEKEVLFAPNAKFKVLEVKQITKKDPLAKKITALKKLKKPLWVAKIKEKVAA